MKLMKRTICILMFLFFAVGSTAITVQAGQGASHQSDCPIMGGAVNKDVYVDYEGKRIYFCCTGCVQEFNKNPAKYMKKLEEQGVEPEAAPKP